MTEPEVVREGYQYQYQYQYQSEGQRLHGQRVAGSMKGGHRGENEKARIEFHATQPLGLDKAEEKVKKKQIQTQIKLKRN